MAVWHHTDFKFHRRITQIGCYWGPAATQTELYLVEGERLALIDTGVAGSPGDYVEPALRAIGRTLKDIGVVINTHGHHDHAGGNHAVWEASGCEIWMHEADARIVEDAAYQFAWYFARTPRLTGKSPEEVAEAQRAHAAMAGAPAPVSRTFRDGEVLDLGGRVELRVVHTPGHTFGSCTFLWEREGIAIAGDSVLGRSSVNGLPLIYQPDQYRRTIARLEEIGPRVLCLGHHYHAPGLTDESIKYDDHVPAYLAASREVEAVIAAAVDDAVRELTSSAPFDALARRALGIIQRRLPVQDDPARGWPSGAVPLISSYLGLAPPL